MEARIVTMLSWHDESPELLHDVIVSAARAGSTELVAVPGPYALYPYDRVEPTQAEYDAIQTAVDECSMGLIMPNARVYEGSEVEKRSIMLTDALAATTDDDWLLVLDTDHLVVQAPSNLLGILAGTSLDVVKSHFVEHFDAHGRPIELGFKHYTRQLMRARRDLRMGPNHYTYISAVGKSLLLGVGSTVPALDLYDTMTIHHRHHVRADAKRAAQAAYYVERDSRGLETA